MSKAIIKTRRVTSIILIQKKAVLLEIRILSLGTRGKNIYKGGLRSLPLALLHYL